MNPDMTFRTQLIAERHRLDLTQTEAVKILQIALPSPSLAQFCATISAESQRLHEEELARFYFPDLRLPTRRKLTRRQIGARTYFFGDLVTDYLRVAGRYPSWAGMRALFIYATRKASLV